MGPRAAMIRDFVRAQKTIQRRGRGDHFGFELGLPRPIRRLKNQPITKDWNLADDVSTTTSFESFDISALPTPSFLQAPSVTVGSSSQWIAPTLPSVSNTAQSFAPIQAADPGGSWLGNLVGALTPAISNVGGTLLNNLVSRETQKEAIKTYGTPMTDQAIEAYRNRDQLVAAQRGGTVLTAGTVGMLALGGLALILIAKKRKAA